MQYFVNNENNETDVIKHYGYNGVSTMLSIAGDMDYQIMKARILAKNRGASPVDVQITVALLDTDNLIKYERSD